MRTLYIFLIIILIPLQSYSQKKNIKSRSHSTTRIKNTTKSHLQIMGVPIQGTMDEFCDKLVKTKNLVDTHKDPNYLNSKSNTLKGEFWEFSNCDINVCQKDGFDQVTNVIVVVNNISFMKDKVDKLIKTYTQKFGKPVESNSSVYATLTWTVTNGNISINISKWSDYINIVYDDYIALPQKANNYDSDL